MHANPYNQTDRRSPVIGAWPLLLTLDQACDYLGVSPGTFRKVCPVPPIALGAAVNRWHRVQLEDWVNTLPPKNTGRAAHALPITSPTT